MGTIKKYKVKVKNIVKLSAYAEKKKKEKK